jgi:hypothetical protein
LIRKKSTTLRLIVLLTVMIAGLIWTGNLALEERVVTLRYLLFTLSGFIAFITPYLIFPDPGIVLVQLANLTGRDLLRYIFSGFARYQWPLLVLIFLAASGDLITPLESLMEKLIYMLNAVFLFSGLNLLALSRYIRSGTDSQFWQESERGKRLRKQVADYMKYPLDPGSVPSMINTLLVSSTGMIAVVTGAYLSEVYGAEGELAAGIVVLVFGSISFLKLRNNTERHYYATNAFYSEFFSSGTGEESVVERRKADQLWWVPGFIRAGVWQFLQQIDRKIPAGRAVAAGHLFVWFVAYQRPGEDFITAMWILFGLVHHLFIFLTMQKAMAPGWLLRWIESGSRWFLIRFWMQFRWLLPLFISMNAQAFVFGYPAMEGQFLVIGVFLLSGALISAVAAIQLKRTVQ